MLGAGIAGAAAARALSDAGLAVALFDKGRGPGGRMATRREPFRFDHGAQYVRARDPSFAAAVAEAEAAGAVAVWPAMQGEPPALVGTPSMTGLVRHFLGPLALTTGFTATALSASADGWHLVCDAGAAGPFEAVIVTVPSVQAVPLLLPHHRGFAAAAEGARYAPCWAGMFAFSAAALPALRTLATDAFAAAGVSWAAHDGGKPGRGDAPTMVLHGSPEWSTLHLEEPADAVRERFAAILRAHGWPTPVYAAAHRWRYAMVTEAAAVETPFDGRSGLGIAGDWLAGPRVEAAFLSGRQVAAALLASRQTNARR